MLADLWDCLIRREDDPLASYIRQEAKRFFDNHMVLVTSFMIDIRGINDPTEDVSCRYNTQRRVEEIYASFSLQQMGAAKACIMDKGKEAKWREMGLDEVTREEARTRAHSKMQR